MPGRERMTDDPTIAHDDWLSDRIRDLDRPSTIHDRIERAREIANLCRLRVEKHDLYTKEHSVRVARWSKVIAGRLPTFDKERQIRLEITALVHDYGKIDVPATILNKPDGLAPGEFEEVKKHPLTGAQRLEPFAEFIDMDGVLYHHVRFDGGGYPDQAHFRKHAIPLEARIIAVADTFDALTSDRAYRKGLAPERALEIMSQVGGKQLDPTLVRIFQSYHKLERASKGWDVGATTMEIGATVDEEIRRAREFLKRKVGDYDRMNPLAKVADKEGFVRLAVDHLVSLSVDRDMAEKFVRSAYLMPMRETFAREDIALGDKEYDELIAGTTSHGRKKGHAEVSIPLVRRKPEHEVQIAVFNQKLWKCTGDGTKAVLIR
jgi:hypothetical protein